MKIKKLIYLKLQTIEDLKISYKWRNDKKIWKETLGGGKFKKTRVTFKDELEWFKRVQFNNRINLSIFVEPDKLIGNIYFSSIKKNEGVFHIVIGNKSFWNKGFGFKATIMSIYYAKINLNIKKLYLQVKQSNTAAIKIYKKIGFKFIRSNKKSEKKMKLLTNKLKWNI